MSEDDKNHKRECGDDSSSRKNPPGGFLEEKVSRRDFLKRSAVVASGSAALIAAMSPLRLLKESITAEEFVQKHYKEMNKEELDRVMERIKKKIRSEERR